MTEKTTDPTAADDAAMQVLSVQGAQCGDCGDEPGDRTCPDCERCRGWYVKALREAGWAPRAEIERARDEQTAAWLCKKAREFPTVRAHQEPTPDYLRRLADKILRGAVRPNNLLGAPESMSTVDLTDWADKLAAAGLQPQEPMALRLAGGGWDLAVQVATHPDLTDAAREELLREIRKAVDKTVKRVLCLKDA